MALRQAQLHPYEQLCSGMNIGVALIVNSRSKLSAKQVEHALQAASFEHPYLRQTIQKVGEHPAFVDAGTLQVEVKVGEQPAANAREYLQDLVNRPQENSKALTVVELHTPSDVVGVTVLYLVFNHAGCDGPGIFSTVDAFLSQLAIVIEKGLDCASTQQSRPLVDVLSRIPQALKEHPRLQPPEEFLPPLAPLPSHGQEKSDPYISGTSFEFTAEQTQHIIASCRGVNASVQGAVSAASAIGLVALQQTSLPQTLCLQAPVNMRQHVSPPVEAGACVCGSSALWWTQELDRDQSLLHVAAVCTEKMREARSRHSGFAWWHWLQAEFYAPPVTVMATSMGVIPVRDKYGGIHVQQVHFQGGSFGLVDPSSATVMTHAYTFDGRLRVVVSTTQPMVGPRRAELFAAAQERYLMYLASSSNPSVADFIDGLSM